MSERALAAVRDHVVASPEVAARLVAIVDEQALGAAIVVLAGELGHDLSQGDVDAALAAGRRRALERWR